MDNVMLKSDVTISLMCLFATSPNATSVRHWLKQGCQVYCSLPTHYSTNVAQHTGTLLLVTYLPICLPSLTKILTSRPNS